MDGIPQGLEMKDLKMQDQRYHIYRSLANDNTPGVKPTPRDFSNLFREYDELRQAYAQLEREKQELQDRIRLLKEVLNG